MGAAEDVAARVVELQGRYLRLQKWGAREKLPWTRETQDSLDKFFRDARAGKLDVRDVEGATQDVRHLELYAAENGLSDIGPPKTKYDIEKSDGSLEAAKTAVDASNEAKAVARDATKDFFETIKDGAKQVPWWAWGAAGTIVATYLLGQVATISRAFGGNPR